jgi:hypothetical protein
MVGFSGWCWRLPSAQGMCIVHRDWECRATSYPRWSSSSCDTTWTSIQWGTLTRQKSSQRLHLVVIIHPYINGHDEGKIKIVQNWVDVFTSCGLLWFEYCYQHYKSLKNSCFGRFVCPLLTYKICEWTSDLKTPNFWWFKGVWLWPKDSNI